MGSNTTTHRAKTRLFLILLLLALACPIASQEAPVLAILPFEGVAVSRADVDAVYTYMESSFSATGVYTVVTAEQRDQILESPDVAFCTDEDCAVEVGNKLSAEQVVLGTVALSDGRYIVNARIIATANSRTLAADSIGAAGPEELAQVCNTLTVGLIKRAMPGSLVENVEETEAAADQFTAESEGADTGGAGRRITDGALKQPGEGDDTEGSSGKLTRADLWPLVNICGGMFMLELGNVMGSLGFELNRRISEPDGEAGSATFGYYFTTSLSYVSWSAAVASVPAYLLFFPDKAFMLSKRGKRIFTAGVMLSISGNVLDLLASEQRYTNDFLYDNYLSAGTGFDELHDQYRRGYILYSAERLTSYAFWLLGGAGMIGAFFIPGPEESPIEGFWDRAVFVGGMTLVGLGSVTRTLALAARQTHVDSGGDEKAYDRYVLNRALSYSFWALGGLGMVLPFAADFGGEKPTAEATQLRPEQLRLVPLPNGMILQYAY